MSSAASSKRFAELGFSSNSSPQRLSHQQSVSFIGGVSSSRCSAARRLRGRWRRARGTAHCLVWRRERAREPKICCFRDWITARCAARAA